MHYTVCAVHDVDELKPQQKPAALMSPLPSLQVSARLHGLLPASSAGSGSLTGMLISHGPLAAAAAAGAAHGGGLRSGQGVSRGRAELSVLLNQDCLAEAA
jgi:hypothetical protein